MDGSPPETANAFADVRLTAGEYADMERTAARLGCGSVIEYLRRLHALAAAAGGGAEEEPSSAADRYPLDGIRTWRETRFGRALHGDALCYLFNGTPPKSVDLIMTSPPFGLVRKKTYGNEDAHRYCDWFRPFAEDSGAC